MSHPSGKTFIADTFVYIEGLQSDDVFEAHKVGLTGKVDWSHGVLDIGEAHQGGGGHKRA